MGAYDRLEQELTQFGLTHQEAVVYITLLTGGELTGYEVAKLTGISRSNTYNALAGLTDKGAACYYSDGVATKYTPVELEEFTGNVLYELKRVQASILANPPKLIEKSEGYITISGYDNAINKIRNMILSAKLRMYLVANADIVEQFRVQLETKITQGVKVVILTSRDIQLDGSTAYIMEDMKNQVRLIVDSQDVFTGTLEEEQECSCLYSRNSNFVDVFKEMLRSEIILLEQKYNKPDTVLVAMSKNI